MLLGPDSVAKTETQATVAWVRDQILALLHPFMPFITEELWAVTAEGGVARDGMLALGPWPLLAGLDDAAAEAEIGWLIDLVAAIRSVRTEMTLAPALEIPLLLADVCAATAARARRWDGVIKRMARISEIHEGAAPPAGAVQLVVRGETVALPLKGIIDLDAEKARLTKDLAKADGDISRIDAKLGNPDFVARAPEEVIDADREKRDEAMRRRAKIVEALERLRRME